MGRQSRIDRLKMISIYSLVKVFGMRPVLRGVNLTVEEGEFVSLFGPNGAGKTTMLRIVAGLSRPTGGEVRIAGRTSSESGHAMRHAIGVVAHQPLVYGDLTAQENLEFYAKMYDLSGEQAEARIAEVLEAVGLRRRSHDFVRTFSRGMQQRLAIARAILHDPPVLLFDEPHTGLDQDAAAALDGVLTEVAMRGRTILMPTHDIVRGLNLADRVVILSKGVIAYETPTAETDPIKFADTYAEITGMVSVR